MNFKLLLFILLLLKFYTIKCQNVKGKVFDIRNQNAIPRVLVKIEGGFLQTETDIHGIFQLKNVPSGQHILIISKEGYLTQKLPFSKKQGEEINLNSIFLEADVQELQHENIISLSESDFADDVDIDYTGGMLQATRDLFLTRAAFDFGQVFFKVKGYDAMYGDVLMNGIRMNGLFNGKPQWNQWGGLNDVMRNQEYFHGLKSNPYTFGGMLGTTYINTDPSEMRPGFRLSASASNRTYFGRLMATYSSGVSKKGLSYTVSTSKRWAKEGYMDGTLYDAYSFFASVGYQISEKHQVLLTGLYSPNYRGKSAAITEEVFELADRKYNPYWGYQDGEIRNSRSRKIEKPMAMFNYNYSGDRLQIKLAAAYWFGLYSSSRLGYFNAPSPNPDYYRYLPSFYINGTSGANFENANLAKDAFLNDPQLDWNSMYLANQNNNNGSSYVLYNDETDENVLSANLNFNYTFSPMIRLDGGFQYQSATSENYGLLTDLLGSTYHNDIDPFSDTSNDLKGNARKAEGDRISYNYQMNSGFYEGFLQTNVSWDAFQFFISGKLSQTTYQRNGRFQNGRYPENSEGESEQLSLSDYGAKAGISYKLNNRHILTATGTYYTKSPTLQNAFVNARENNRVVDSLVSEKIYSGNVTYNLLLPKITARLTTYYAQFSDATDIHYFYVDAGVGSDFVQEVVTGISKRHYGAEMGFSYQASPEIKLTAAAAYGDFRYTSNAHVEINFDTAGEIDELINNSGSLNLGATAIKDYRLAVGPQKAYAIGVEYRSPQYWWVGLTGNYMDDNYVDISTIKRTDSFLINPDGGTFPNATDENIARLLRQEKLDPVYLLNLTGGKSWLFGKKYIGLFVSINNLFDEVFRTGGYEQSRNANFGQAYQDEERGAPSFGNKYWYGYGRTFFINLSLSF